MKLTILAVLAGLLAACATTERQHVEPIASVIDANIAAQLGGVEVPADKALIYLYRPNRAIGSANIYRIALNRRSFANLKVGTRWVAAVKPGSTMLQGASNSVLPMEKPNIIFETEAGKVYFIDVKTGFAGGPEFKFVDATTGLNSAENLQLADPTDVSSFDGPGLRATWEYYKEIDNGTSFYYYRDSIKRLDDFSRVYELQDLERQDENGNRSYVVLMEYDCKQSLYTALWVSCHTGNMKSGWRSCMNDLAPNWMPPPQGPEHIEHMRVVCE